MLLLVIILTQFLVVVIVSSNIGVNLYHSPYFLNSYIFPYHNDELVHQITMVFQQCVTCIHLNHVTKQILLKTSYLKTLETLFSHNHLLSLVQPRNMIRVRMVQINQVYFIHEFNAYKIFSTSSIYNQVTTFSLNLTIFF
jgi:hypothetical protein